MDLALRRVLSAVDVETRATVVRTERVAVEQQALMLWMAPGVQ